MLSEIQLKKLFKHENDHLNFQRAINCRDNLNFYAAARDSFKSILCNEEKIWGNHQSFPLFKFTLLCHILDMCLKEIEDQKALRPTIEPINLKKALKKIIPKILALDPENKDILDLKQQIETRIDSNSNNNNNNNAITFKLPAVQIMESVDETEEEEPLQRSQKSSIWNKAPSSLNSLVNKIGSFGGFTKLPATDTTDNLDAGVGMAAILSNTIASKS